MVSIKDIAADCNTSIATVSKAINGHRDVSDRMRKKVLESAHRLGYMPNAAARSLKTNRSYNLGVLFVDENNSGLTNEYFAGVLDSFKKEAENKGYDITFINRNIGGKRTSYLEHCRYRGVDGVVVACVKFSDPEVAELVQSDLPVVTVDHVFNNRTSVLSDNTDGVQEIVDNLADLGHKRIAFIHGESHSSVTEKRLAGFFKACADRNIPVPEEYIQSAIYHDAASTAAATSTLLALPTPPTAILFPDDFSAIGGIHVIEDAGLTIPEDISVAGYDGINLSTILKPQLLTYRQDTEELGLAAAQLLIRLIDEPRTTLPEQRVVCGELQKGGTAAKPRR